MSVDVDGWHAVDGLYLYDVIARLGTRLQIPFGFCSVKTFRQQPSRLALPEEGLSVLKLQITLVIRHTQFAVVPPGIRDFKRIANKYGVDFAIVKDKNEDPPRYTVFFKAKDADAITSVLKEYGDRMEKRGKEAGKERPSILNKLKKFKEIVANTPSKHREKRKEQER